MDTLSEQPAAVREKCKELAKLRQCTVDTAWKKAVKAAQTLRIRELEGFTFCLSVAQALQSQGEVYPWTE
jgi:hypothetical protein